MHGPKYTYGHVTHDCWHLNGNHDKKKSYLKPSKWNQNQRKHKQFSKEEVKAFFESMYSRSAKKWASYREKTQEKLWVFEKLKVDSGDEKEEKISFRFQFRRF